MKELVDREEISTRAAVELSYLSLENQSDLFNVLQQDGKIKIDMKKSGLLRGLSKNNKLTPQTIENILSCTAVKNRNRASLPVQSVKIKGKILSKYFKPEQKPEEIEAIAFYMEHKNSKV